MNVVLFSTGAVITFALIVNVNSNWPILPSLQQLLAVSIRLTVTFCEPTFVNSLSTILYKSLVARARLCASPSYVNAVVAAVGLSTFFFAIVTLIVSATIAS